MSRRGLTWSTVGLVVLAVATAVIVLAALRGTAPLPAPRPSGSALASPPAASATPDDEGQARDVRLQPVEPLLAAVDGRVAWRGSAGTCAGGAVLERTSDGGATWRPVVAPVATISALRLLGPSQVELVGAGPSGVADAAACTPGVWTSGDSGRSWSGPDDASAVWYRDPQRAGQLHSPAGPVPNPCPDRDRPVVELAGLTAVDAVLLCPGGSLYRTADAGARWARVADQPGAVAMAWQSPDTGWLLDLSDERCPSVVLLRTIDGGGSWSPGGCLGQDPVVAEEGGLPSLAFADVEVGIAIVSGGVFTTADGGLTWRLVG